MRQQKKIPETESEHIPPPNSSSTQRRLAAPSLSGRPIRDAHILVFDNEASWATTWRDLLRDRGFVAEAETDPRQVKTHIVGTHYEVILLDVVTDSDYDGIDVLMDIMTYSRKSQVIVVTGPGTTEQVVTCIKRGACDFISKDALSGIYGIDVLVDRITVAMQSPFIANSLEVVRENLIDSLWGNIHYGDRGQKGRRLEQLMKLIFESLPAFFEVTTTFRSKSEQFDLLIMHGNANPPWCDLGAMYLGECKNWNMDRNPAQEKDLASFEVKLQRRGIMVRMGFFISMSGFSKGFMDATREFNAKEKVVVPLDKKDVEVLVRMRTGEARDEYLRSKVVRATMM